LLLWQQRRCIDLAGPRDNEDMWVAKVEREEIENDRCYIGVKNEHTPFPMNCYVRFSKMALAFPGRLKRYILLQISKRYRPKITGMFMWTEVDFSSICLALSSKF